MSDSGEGRYRTLSSETVFSGRVLKVKVDEVEMPDGTAKREYVGHPGAVAVVALDDAGAVVLVEQYRYPVRRRLRELPAGLLDVAGEPAVRAAARELFEEARLHAARWDVLVDLYTTPGMTDEAVRVYLARELTDATEAYDATGEEVELTVSRSALADAADAVLAGEITNSIAVAGILAADRAQRDGFAGLRPADAPWSAKPDLAP
ncbi:NUDIX domain-containing protein [Jatrophihabitans sp. YIM 134969]